MPVFSPEPHSGTTTSPRTASPPARTAAQQATPVVSTKRPRAARSRWASRTPSSGTVRNVPPDSRTAARIWRARGGRGIAMPSARVAGSTPPAPPAAFPPVPGTPPAPAPPPGPGTPPAPTSPPGTVPPSGSRPSAPPSPSRSRSPAPTGSRSSAPARNAAASGDTASAWTAISRGRAVIRPSARSSATASATPSSSVPLPTGTARASGSRPPRSSHSSYAYVFVPCRKYGLKTCEA